jgi:hypothetical protein
VSWDATFRWRSDVSEQQDISCTCPRDVKTVDSTAQIKAVTGVVGVQQLLSNEHAFENLINTEGMEA